MKNLSMLFVLFLMIGANVSVNAQTEKADEVSVSETTVEIYYFHNTRRCPTCEAVEDVTLNTIKTKYPEQMKSGVLSFKSLNIEDDSNEALARKLHVSGQTLLVVKNGKKKDLTNDAFLYARTKPEKLSQKLEKVIGTI